MDYIKGYRIANNGHVKPIRDFNWNRAIAMCCGGFVGALIYYYSIELPRYKLVLQKWNYLAAK